MTALLSCPCRPTNPTKVLSFVVCCAVVGLPQIAGCGREMIAESSYCQRFGICNEHIKADSVPVKGIDCR